MRRNYRSKISSCFVRPGTWYIFTTGGWVPRRVGHVARITNPTTKRPSEHHLLPVPVREALFGFVVWRVRNVPRAGLQTVLRRRKRKQTAAAPIMTKTKIVPTEIDPPSATSDAAQGGAYVEAISEPIASHVEQPTQEGGGSVGSTAPLPAEENIPREERGSTAPVHAEENIPPSANRFPSPPDTAAAAAAAAAEVEGRLQSSSTDKDSGGGVLDDASNASNVSNTVPEPGDNKDEVEIGSLLNPINSTPSGSSQEGQPNPTVNVEGSKEDEAGGSARVSPTPNFSGMDGKDKHGDGDDDGGGTTGRTLSLSHPNADTASLASADKSPSVLTSGDQEESKDNNSRASSRSNNTLDTEEYEEDFKPAGGAVFARRGTRRFIPRSSSDKANDTLASEKRSSFRVPPAMYMGHPVGSLSAEFLERHEHRVKEATIRRASVSELLKLVMNHDPISSGSPMPDVDVVFPDYHSDQNEGDWFV